MGDRTLISWTDHTFNPWWGCTKIAPGCDNCYAAALDSRTGGDYWNPRTKPRLTSSENWRRVLRWEKSARDEGVRRRVFCGSMMDWCDNDVSDDVRDKLFDLIKETPSLDWQLLTKRATRIEECLPADWGGGYMNVWLGVTVEDMQFGFPRVDALRNVPAAIRFISAEPLLERLIGIELMGVHWCIIGGESGSRCRAMAPEWAVALADECVACGVPIWFKQWGGRGAEKGGCIINGGEIKQLPR